MFISDEEVTALRAELERAKKDLARIRREGETMKQKKEYERLRRERSWGTSFDRQGGDSSARNCCSDYGLHVDTWGEYRC